MDKASKKFCEEETDAAIKSGLEQHLAKDTAALAMITTYTPARITPSKAIIAQIGLIDELGIEDAINAIKENNKDITKLFLLVNSFGGGVMSSFKIAKAITIPSPLISINSTYYP